GDAIGAFGEFGEGDGGCAITDDFQSRLACSCAACQLSVEPIERIVKMGELGPAEFRMCGLVVGPMREQKVTRSLKRFGPHRNVSFSEDSPQTSHMDRRYSAVIITLASYLSRQPFLLTRITWKQEYLPHSVPYSCWLSSLLIEGRAARHRSLTGALDSNSLRAWFGVVMFRIAVTGMAVVIILRFLYARST